MVSRVMGWGRVALVVLAVSTLASSRLSAVPEPAAIFQAAPIPYLAAYWPLETDASDQSGNGNNGTFANTAAPDSVNFAPVPSGNAGSASFPGPTSGSQITVPDSTSLSITGSITVAAWIKTGLTPPNTDQQEIIGKFTGGGYFLRLNQSGGLDFSITSTGGTSGTSETSLIIPTDTWTHVAGTYDHSTGAVHIFIGGVQRAESGTSADPADGSSGLLIGRDGSNQFKGNIDEARIYSVALSEAAIATLVTMVQPPPTALVATPGPAKIDLNWAAPASGPTPIAYNIYRSVSGGSYTLYATSSGPSYIDTSVSNPTSYSYKVTAVAALESSQAGPAAAVPLPTLPKTTTGAQNHNIGHRCGCHTITAPVAPGILWSAAALSALALLLRRRR